MNENEGYPSPFIDTSNEVTLNKSLNGMLNIMLEQNQTIKQQTRLIQELQAKIKGMEKEIKVIKAEEIKDAHEVLKDELRKEMVLFMASIQLTQNHPSKKKMDSLSHQLNKKFLNIQTPYKGYNKVEDEDNIAKLSNRIVCQNSKNKELYDFLIEDLQKYTKRSNSSSSNSSESASGQMEFINKDINILKESVEMLNSKLNNIQASTNTTLNNNDNDRNIDNNNNNGNNIGNDKLKIDDVTVLKKQMVQMEEECHHIMMCVTQNRKQLEKKVDLNYFKQEMDSLCNQSTILENQNTINEIKNSLKKIQSDCSLLQPPNNNLPSPPPTHIYRQEEALKQKVSAMNTKYEDLNSQVETIKSALIANNLLRVNHEADDGLDVVPVMSIHLNSSQMTTKMNENENSGENQRKSKSLDEDGNDGSSDNESKSIKIRMDKLEKVLHYVMEIFNIRMEDLMTSHPQASAIIHSNCPLVTFLWTKLKNDTQALLESKWNYFQERMDTQHQQSIQEVWDHLEETMVSVQQQMASVKNILTELTKKLSYYQYTLGEFNENDERYFENSIQLLLQNNNSSMNYYKNRLESQKYLTLSDRINIVYDAIKHFIISKLYESHGSKESVNSDSLLLSQNDTMNKSKSNTTNNDLYHENNNNHSNNNTNLDSNNDSRIEDRIQHIIGSSIYKEKMTGMIKEILKPRLLKIKNILQEKVNNDVLKELMRHLITREELKMEMNHFSLQMNERMNKIEEECREGKEGEITGCRCSHCSNSIRKSYSNCHTNDPNTNNNNPNSNTNFHTSWPLKDTQTVLNTYLKKLIIEEEEEVEKEKENKEEGANPNNHNYHHPYLSKSLNSWKVNHPNEEEENLLKVYINLLIHHSSNNFLINSNNTVNPNGENNTTTTAATYNNNNNNNKNNNNNNFILSQHMQIEIEKLENSFDEKLFLLASDINSCKALYQQSLRQPYGGACGQWIWNSETLQYDSSIPWNLETYNTDGHNFQWEMNGSQIRVQQEGIYEISFAFFTKVKPTIKLMINGETVMSAINSSSYVVHHSSGYVLANGKLKPGSSTGLSLMVNNYFFLFFKKKK